MATYIDDIRQGDTHVFELDFGKGTDITGWKFYFILRDKLDDTTNVIQVLATAGGNPLDDILNGLGFLTVSSVIRFYQS